jgi:hypothetical protein
VKRLVPQKDHSARKRLDFDREYRAGQHRHHDPDAFPNHARPCEGKFLVNGDFITVSGRHITGPLCKVCGGLADIDKCLACGASQ